MPKLKDIPKFDRPREKFLEKGPDALTDSELLAILLDSGIKGTNVKILSQNILKKFGDDFLNVSVDDLTQISGIGQAKALQIASAIALTKRIFEKQSLNQNLPKDKKKNDSLRFIDFCAGIGAGRLGLENLGLNCVGFSEIDKNSEKTYREFFGQEEKNYGDLMKINTNNLPDFDLMIAGFPCQSFSVIGQRKGMCDRRGQIV